MDRDEILQMFEGDCGERVFWISTCDGMPHLAPVCFVRYMDGRIVVAYNFIKRTVRNVEKSERASIGFAERGEKGFYGYMVKGRAWVDYGGMYYSEIRKFVQEKSKGRRIPKGALVIEPEEIYSLSPGEGKKKIY